MNFIRSYFNTPFVKILTEIRRCGKTTLLEMIIEEINLNKRNYLNAVLLNIMMKHSYFY